jgi:glutamate-1-semialdehyde 2,1-aminomutase
MIKQMNFTQSALRFERSKRSLAGGVSSGLRSASKPCPLFFQSGSGAYLVDVDGNEFIDYTLAWGPLILGHCSEVIHAAVSKQMGTLQQVGAQHDLEWEVAEQICRLVPSADQVLFSNTGTEAVQVAIRLARAFTGRNKILRFEGHYHGWMDNVLTGYRPASETSGGPARKPSEGMSATAESETIALPWNDLSLVEDLLREHGNSIAAIITEPILGNSSCLMPLPGYLQGLRDLATRYGCVLIFDEVITGFRVHVGGAQSYFGVTPDLTTFGKAIAGGFSLSAVAGRSEILKLVAEHRVVHAGTFNGNPLSLAAAKAVLDYLESDQGEVLNRIRANGELLINGIRAIAEKQNVPILINGVGSIFHLSFTDVPAMHNFRDTLVADPVIRDRFVQRVLCHGVYLLPDGRWYLSAAHRVEDIQKTLAAVASAFCDDEDDSEALTTSVLNEPV